MRVVETTLRALGVFLLGLSTTAQSQTVPNADFTEGAATVTGWTLVGENGRWVDRQYLEVTGNGDDSNYWRCQGPTFEPGRLYHFETRARRAGGAGGSAVAGPTFANRDYAGVRDDWDWYGHVFRVPENPQGGYLRVGQWHAAGAHQFDAVRITPSIPVHKAVGELILGEGESIRDGVYTFHGTYGHEGSNYHRVLEKATAGFNSNRWTIDGAGQVTYRFGLPGYKFTSGEVRFNVNYHTRGGCVAEASRDGVAWRLLATQEGLGVGQAALPDDLLPAETLRIRLRSSTPDGSFQVDRVEFIAALDLQAPNATGATSYADVESSADGLELERLVLEDSESGGQTILAVRVKNTAGKRIVARLRATVDLREHPSVALPEGRVEMADGESTTFRLEVPPCTPGEHSLVLTLRDQHSAAGDVSRTSLAFNVLDFYRADYGALLVADPNGADVWWCNATHKVSRRRPAPGNLGGALQLSAARNDFEAVQLVVRPNRDLRGLSAEVSDLRGAESSIPASAVEILQVYYHWVDHPTDRVGVRDWWPDALPPLDKPIDVPAGENQPLWVLVHVAGDTAPGDYTGIVTLKAEGWSVKVPIELHVWDFALPQRNHLETAFGLSAGNVFRYHGLKTEADKRRVMEMYFQLFAEHRISPYDPAPLDPIRVKFLPDADPPRAEIDFTAFDQAMTRAVETYHFTGLRLGIRGMGGGTFHARYDPEIEGYKEDTPQFQAMFSSYVGQIEEHFRQRGWLDEAYIYWFDEPDPKDYEFVANGMQRLKKHAPSLRRMLTEEPSDDFPAAVDIWCPISHNYDHQEAQKRRAHGERLWWYVCTGPKEPYCTLFIDHPATELRVWHWQTWQRDIVGTLVWQSNYWTSSAAFPDTAQNPYEDPMGYVSGYSTPRGTKRFWGNGDGRFVYPPLAAAVPGASGGEPVFERPVSSIRFEMLREGVEDYEYLWMLRDLVSKHRVSLSRAELARYEALLDVPEAITRDMTTFTTDPAPIYERRRQIAEAIEVLGR